MPVDLTRRVLTHSGWFASTNEYGQIERGGAAAAGFSLCESETIRTDENVRVQIRAELERRDVPAEEIEAKSDALDQAAETAFETVPGFTIRKHIDLSVCPSSARMTNR